MYNTRLCRDNAIIQRNVKYVIGINAAKNEDLIILYNIILCYMLYNFDS